MMVVKSQIDVLRLGGDFDNSHLIPISLPENWCFSMPVHQTTGMPELFRSGMRKGVKAVRRKETRFLVGCWECGF